MKIFKLKAMLLLMALLGSVSAFAGDLWLNDVKYTLNDDGTAQVSGADRDIKTAVISERITYEGKDYSVTNIGNNAFFFCNSLTSVTIPNSVTSIGNSAFYNCRSLTSIVIPSSVTSIEDNAFLGCSSIITYKLKGDYTGYVYTAEGSIQTANIPEKITYEGKDYPVTSIGENAFSGCGSLTSVTIPNSVTSIGNSAFIYCN